jgi:hypothetical protein
MQESVLRHSGEGRNPEKVIGVEKQLRCGSSPGRPLQHEHPSL